MAGVNITSCTRIDGDEVYNDLEMVNFSASNRKFKTKQTVQNYSKQTVMAIIISVDDKKEDK